MISYDPFWQTLRQRDISTYQLIYEHGILPDTIQRLRSGKTVTTRTLNTLCSVIDCQMIPLINFNLRMLRTNNRTLACLTICRQVFFEKVSAFSIFLFLYRFYNIYIL